MKELVREIAKAGKLKVLQHTRAAEMQHIMLHRENDCFGLGFKETRPDCNECDLPVEFNGKSTTCAKVCELVTKEIYESAGKKPSTEIGKKKKQPINSGKKKKQPINSGKKKKQPINSGKKKKQPINSGKSKKGYPRPGSKSAEIWAEFDAGNFNKTKIAAKLDANPNTISTQLYKWKKCNEQ